IHRKLRVEGNGKAVANALVVFGAHLMARTDAAGEAPILEDAVAWIIHPDFPITHPTMPSPGPSPVAKLPKAIALRGRVLNATGPGVKADLFVSGMQIGSSGDDGAFTLARVPAPWPALRAVAGKEAALVPHSNAATVDVRLAPAAMISGTLRDEAGARVVGGRVTMRFSGGANDPAAGGAAIYDARGRFARVARP